MAKLLAKLPEGDKNGLGAIDRDLLDDPKKVHVAIVLLDGKKSVTDADSGASEVWARIRQIEVINEDRDVLEKLIRRALERRTGQTVLPFDLEDELEAAFGDFSEEEPSE